MLGKPYTSLILFLEHRRLRRRQEIVNLDTSHCANSQQTTKKKRKENTKSCFNKQHPNEGDKLAI